MRTKHLFYSNFKFYYKNKNENINELSIEEISNLNTDNGFIQSELSTNELLFELFDKEQANLVKNNNEQILAKTIKIIPYEFFSETNNLKTLRLFAISEDNILYELNFEDNIFEQKYTFTCFQNDTLSKNILYFFDSQNKCIIIENNNILTIEDIPTIDSFVFYEEKIYFSVQNNLNKLYIGEVESLKDISTNLEQYTSINIPVEDGMIYKLVCIKNQIFIITQYSIFKINIDEQLIQKQNNINTLIFKNSINQLDDSIIFFSEGGLFIFDGVDLKLIFENFLNISKNANFVIFNQKLYILSNVFANLLIKYNFGSDEISFIKIDNLKYFYKINTYSYHCICASCKDNDSIIITSLYSNNTSDTLSQSLKFKPTFLSNNNLKQIQSININANGNFTLKILSDISSSYFDVSNTTNLSNLSIDGNYFIFEISSKSKFKLNSILLTFNEIGE